MARTKLAVLIPVFNGGALLASTIQSCAGAGLPGSDYEILVVDNQSTDGAVGQLPGHDGAGAPIRVYRNDRNLGRVGNWNRAVDLAAELGFDWYTFLFVGDCWMPAGSLPRLLDLMELHQADIGLAAFESADGEGRRKSISERFRAANGQAVLPPQKFLQKVLGTGLLPFGPIQANVYRTRGNLRFDPDLPRSTDVESTVDYVSRCHGPVVVMGEPYFSWREHNARFHTATRVIDFIEDAPRMFDRARRRCELPVDSRRAISTLFVNALRSVVVFERPTRWPVTLAQVLRYYGSLPDRVSPKIAAEILVARLVKRRHLLEVC